jgi:hypothetical protein
MTKSKKAVKSNPSIIQTETTRTDVIDMDREMQYCMKKIPISQARIERIKDKLRVFLDENPNAKTISSFYYTQDISQSTYERLCKRDPELGELHKMTMHKMGNKMYENSVDCRANWNAVHFKIHQYAPEYKEAKEYNAQLAKKDDVADKGPIFVVMDSFPNSDVVKEKK